jgi:pimeloyl-ACP methyl ester carboxylesterase
MQAHNTPTFDPARSADSLNDLPRVTVNGAPFAYRERGTGEPVVLVHGSVSDIRTWQQPLSAIGESHRAIAYSRRYARPNDDITPGADDQMLPHVADLTCLLEALDAAPAHLVGHSWGAFICLLTAIHHPDVVRTLVLEEPPVLSLYLSTPPRATELVALLARRPKTAVALIAFGARTIAPAQKAFKRGDDEEALRRFALGVLGRDSYGRVPEERKQQMRENVNAFRAQMLGAGFPPLTEDEVRGVRAPSLLITGERTPAFQRHLSDRVHQLLPRAERITVADASHRLHEENPTAVNEAIVSFISQHTQRTTHEAR